MTLTPDRLQRLARVDSLSDESIADAEGLVAEYLRRPKLIDDGEDVTQRLTVREVAPRYDALGGRAFGDMVVEGSTGCLHVVLPACTPLAAVTVPDGATVRDSVAVALGPVWPAYGEASVEVTYQGGWTLDAGPARIPFAVEAAVARVAGALESEGLGSILGSRTSMVTLGDATASLFAPDPARSQALIEQLAPDVCGTIRKWRWRWD